MNATELSPEAALAALQWQIELGADEALLEDPMDRFALTDPVKAPVSATATSVPQQATTPVATPDVDPVAEARAAADGATSLTALEAALGAYTHCELRKGARNLVFSDGQPGSRVMIIGEAPGRDEDLQGKPFVGRAGQLLDRMLDAIGHARAPADGQSAVYITNILPWRPPQNRDPKPDEIAMMKPFIERHVALAEPEVLVLMGNISCHALLGRRGITRLRGTWTEALGRPALPMFHPAYLLRNPAAKREAWTDLLMLQSRLRGDR